jgi:DNA-binding CsgD family transcriptional regulator
VDQVHLGVVSSATPFDLEAPHTADKAEDLRLRLQPLLSRIAERESGIIGLNIIATDGTVVYSDTPGAQGLVIPPGEQQLLAGALAGRVKAARSELTGPEHAQRRAQYPSAIEVYVPIVFDGAVHGAYEIYEDGTFLEATAQLAAAAVVVGTCLVFHVLGRVVARRRRFGSAEAGVVSPAPAAGRIRRTSGAFRARRGAELTPREQQVLALLATSDSYHQIAEALVVSDETVRTHVKRILRKLETPNRTQAVMVGMRAGILKPTSLESSSPLTNRDGPPSPIHPAG